MSESLTQIHARLLRGLGANTLGKGVTIITQLLGIPIFLHYWGVVLYGEWLIISTIPAYLAMSELGFGHATANAMAMRVGRNDRDGALEMFRSTAIFIALMMSGAMALALVLLWSAPFERWLGLEQLQRNDAILTIVLLLLKLAVVQQMGLLLAGFRCEGRYPLGQMVLNTMYLGQFLGVAFVVMFGGNPWQAVSADLFVTLIIFVAVRMWLRRIAPWMSYGNASRFRSSMRPLIAPALAFAVFPLTQVILIQGSILLVGTLLGATALVFFNTVRTLTNSLLRLLEVITNSVWPEISLVFARNDLSTARRLHRVSAQITFWISALACLVLLAYGEQIHGTWTAGKLAWDSTFFSLMIAAAFVESWQTLSKAVPMATNQHVGMALQLLLNALISLPLLWAMIQWHGLYGIPYTLLIHNALLSFIVLRCALKLLTEQPSGYAAFLLSPVALVTNLNQIRLRAFS